MQKQIHQNEATGQNSTNYVGFTTTVDGGKPPQSQKGKPMIKVSDTLITVSPLSSGNVTLVTTIPQGTALNQRTGDVIYIDKLYMIYECNAANADVFSSMRIIIFQWVPNSALVVPAPADILQNVSQSVNAFYDWNFADQFRILYDRLHSFAGTATTPTASTNQCYAQCISKRKYMKRLNFSPGNTTGSNQIYCLSISDSGVIPSPNLTLNFRITFSEE